MKRVGLLLFSMAFLGACASTPKTTPVPAPASLPDTPLDIDGDGHVSIQEFKDSQLRKFSERDRADGAMDGVADGMTIADFLELQEKEFRRLDTNHDGFLQGKEIKNIGDAK